MVYSNVLEALGNTPLIKLSKIVPEDSAEILVKYEGLNVGGSIKTRTAYSMVTEAEKKGIIDKNTIIVDSPGPRLAVQQYNLIMESFQKKV